ncbi:MAG: alpha/beta fold hydrolase [Acidobacteria bacterium]|nr:alpha/beta fold hydrolase [Acidobacteriota bacterium]
MSAEFNGPAGRLEALLDEPAWGCHIGPVRLADGSGPAADTGVDSPPRVAVVLAHPLPTGGGTMHNKVVYQVAKSLCRTRAAVLRFNFRGVGTSEGMFTDGPGEMADFRAALDMVAARYPGVEIWAAGFSFGAWIAMTVGATDDRVSTVIGIAPPIGRYDFSAVTNSLKPKFLIQGNRDELCPYRETTKFYAQLPDPKELVVVDGADHLFDGKTFELGEAVEDLLGDYGVR